MLEVMRSDSGEEAGDDDVRALLHVIVVSKTKEELWYYQILIYYNIIFRSRLFLLFYIVSIRESVEYL